MTEYRSSSGGGMVGILGILLALVLIVGPSFLPFLGAASKVTITAFGVTVLLVAAVIVVITRLYQKTSADEAFVRTGMGGPKAVIDGGAIVIPVIHNMIPVSLQTMKLIVDRKGEHALITGDNLRADVTAEFFIKVQKDLQAVLDAATSLGRKAINPQEVEKTVFEKLVNALRTVSATKSLSDLHTKREEFASAVQQIVAADLKHNGLTLESVTISKLDQTPTKDLRPEDNVFDAQGAKRVAEITNAAKVETNRIKADAEQRVQEQNVAKDKFLYEQEVIRATADAARNLAIQNAKAEADQQAATFAAEQTQMVGIAKAEQEKAVQVAEVEKAKGIEVANQQREQAAQEAEIQKTKAIELAKREQAIAVADAEKRQADAEKSWLVAEKDREQAAQDVKTVTAKATADREKNVAIIAKQAQAEQQKVEKNTGADIEAYAITRKATADQEAAEKQADARLQLAEADKSAKVLEAEGSRAEQMVPVDVEKARVDVERQNLQNQADFQQIASEMRVTLASIEAQKEVQVARANAMATAMSSAKITVWGDPATVQKMTEAFANGQAWSALVDGLVNGGSETSKQTVASTMSALSAVVEHFTGQKVNIVPAEGNAQLK